MEHSIDRIEGNRSPWGECLVFVVFVMESMNIFVKEFIGMKCAMHPIDSNLKEDNIEKQIKEIKLPSTNVRNIKIDFCVTVFNEKLRDDRETSVDKDRRLSKKNLINNHRSLREWAAFTCKQLLTKNVINCDMPNPSGDPIDTSPSEEITKIGSN